VDAYRCEDADVVLVMIGCFATKARDAVDRLRDSGVPVGLLRPRLVRPWPGQALYEALRGKRAVAVIDQNLAPGKGGVLHGELASVLYGQPDAPPVLASFIGGLGGRDISAEEFYQIAALTRAAADSGRTPPPRLLYSEDELREVRKLQAIAHTEREQLGSPP
jgi:pyruvate ferredoxin oxidoreductase alpha subunit